VNRHLLGTLVGLLDGLQLESGAVNLIRKEVAVAVGVKCTLQGVAFPAEQVVSVYPIAYGISKRPHERVLARLGPCVSWEVLGAPIGFIEDLRDCDLCA